MIEVIKSKGMARKNGWKSILIRTENKTPRKVLFASRLPVGKYAAMDYPAYGGYLFTKFDGKRFWVCGNFYNPPWKKRRVNR